MVDLGCQLGWIWNRNVLQQEAYEMPTLRQYSGNAIPEARGEGAQLQLAWTNLGRSCCKRPSTKDAATSGVLA